MRSIAVVLALASGCGSPAREEPRPAAPPVAGLEDRPSAPPPPRAAALPDVATDWCVDGWRGLSETTCWIAPERGDGGPDAELPDRLLVYLSGIIPPTPRSEQKEKVARVVASAARRAKVVAILPRGRRGIGPTDARDWWAWPTSPADHAALAPALVAEWKAARAKLESAIGRPFARAYLAGSSSGAYFLAALAQAGEVDFDGYAATSGGAIGPRSPRAVRRPFYVGWATGDPTNGAPKALAAHLAAGGWPVRASAIPGGHGAREEYLDEALAFFAADVTPERDR